MLHSVLVNEIKIFLLFKGAYPFISVLKFNVLLWLPSTRKVTVFVVSFFSCYACFITLLWSERYCTRLGDMLCRQRNHIKHVTQLTKSCPLSIYLLQKWSKRKSISFTYTGWPPKKRNSLFFLGLCSDQQLSFSAFLDRASFPHYNNSKIIKFGWELFILWAISYGLSFLGFAINLSLIVPRNSGNRANPENDSP